MQISVKDEPRAGTSIPSAGVGVIVVCLGLIGYSYYWRAERLTEQATFLTQLKEANAWRAPARADVARLGRLVSELERFDPATHSGSKSLESLTAEYNADLARLNLYSKDATGSKKLVAMREAVVLGSIADYLHSLLVTCAFQEDHRLREEAWDTASNKLYDDWWLAERSRPHPTSAGGVADLEQMKQDETRRSVKKLDDAGLKRVLLKACEGRIQVAGQAQQNTERILNRLGAAPAVAGS